MGREESIVVEQKMEMDGNGKTGNPIFVEWKRGRKEAKCRQRMIMPMFHLKVPNTLSIPHYD